MMITILCANDALCANFPWKVFQIKNYKLENNLKWMSICKIYRLTFAQSLRTIIILAAFTKRKVKYEKLKLTHIACLRETFIFCLKTTKTLTYKVHQHLYFRSIQIHSLQNTNQTRGKPTKHTLSSLTNSS